MKRSLFFLVSILSCFILSLVAAKASQPGCIVALNEVYPNPPGSDSGNEWIEIYNCAELPVNLGDWYLEDKSGGKYPLTGTIQPGDFLVIHPTFTLNQTDETITLYNSIGSVIDSMSYSSSTESLSISRSPDGTGDWTKDTQPSANATNVVAQPDPFSDSQEISISELRSEPSSDKTYTIQGITTTASGELYPDRIYIQEDKSEGIEEGILVKLPKDVEVERGEALKLCGVRSTYYNEPIIKVEDTLCIESSQASQVKPQNISEETDIDTFAGSLVSLEGIIEKTSGETVWLDGHEQIRVQIPEEFSITKAREDLISITGILVVQKTSESTTYRIRPRDKADINITTVEELEKPGGEKGEYKTTIPQQPLPPLSTPRYRSAENTKFKEVAVKTEHKAKEELKVLSLTGLSSSLYGIVTLCIKRTT